MVTNHLAFAAIGLLFFAVARIGFRSEDPLHYASWRAAPRWALVMFGSVDGSISPYKLSVEVAGLIWAVGWSAMVLTGDPPSSPLRQILAASLVAALVGCAICWVVASVGQLLREK